MRREDVADVAAFIVVAEEKSFTRAAAKLQLSQSALSQIVRRLEDRLGVRLLSRTTRSVLATEAGERLVDTMAPMLRQLDEQLDDLTAYRDKPAGLIRITAVEHAAKTILYPKIAKLVADYPDITVEIFVDYGLSDVVSERFDAGVRLGEQVAKDMIGVRIGPDIPMAIVGAPKYFRKHEEPTRPEGLVEHRCINLRLPTSDTLYAWPLVAKRRQTRAQVKGPLIFNTIGLIFDAVMDGAGLAYLPLDMVENHVARGRLKQILNNNTPPLPAYHLYYPNRRHHRPAFELLVDSLRYRE